MVTQRTVEWVIMRIQKYVCISSHLLKCENLSDFKETQNLKQKHEIRLQ